MSPLRRVAILSLALVAVLAAGFAGLWVTLPSAAPLVRDNPRTTALIEQRRAEARRRRRPFHPRQIWVGPTRISPRLAQAVVLSEDANFFGHDGIDWIAVRDAAEQDVRAGRFVRGASTITQQLAKNLWLGTEKSLWRKAKEAVLALKLERSLSKRRILTLYLNVVELDDGVFGAEAGARDRFGTSAADLTTAQAVVLASMLPAPRRVELAHPSTWLRRRARRLLDRMLAAGRISPEEHLRASAELERILAGPRPPDDREEPPDEEAPDEGAPSAAAPETPAPSPAAAAPEIPAPSPAAAAPATPAISPAGDAAPGTPAPGPAADAAPAVSAAP